MQTGDVVAYEVRADLVGADYVWTWDSLLRRGSGRDIQFRRRLSGKSRGRRRRSQGALLRIPRG